MAFLIALEKNMPNKWVRLILMPSNGLIQNKKGEPVTKFSPKRTCCTPKILLLPLVLRPKPP